MENIIPQEVLTAIFTRENITLALSIFGSTGTVLTVIYNFLVNRKKLQMRVVGHIYGDTKMLVIYATFENKSRLPISITDINIKIDDVWYSCVQPPIIAFEETEKVNGIVTYHRECTTLSMPINIGSLSGTSGYICFEFPPSAFRPCATELFFSVSSNRGKVFEKTLSLGRQLD